MQANQSASSVFLLLLGGLVTVAATKAATATAKVEATIRSSAQVVADANSQLLVSSTVGVLTMSIPGGGGSVPSTLTLTASSPVSSGSAFVFSASDSANLAAVISQIATSGGTLSTSGTLSGSSVQIVVTQAPVGGSSTVTAIVTYN